MIQIDNESATAIRVALADKALELRRMSTRYREQHATARGPTRQRMLAYLADSYEESAIVLEKRQAGVNPNPQRGIT